MKFKAVTATAWIVGALMLAGPAVATSFLVTLEEVAKDQAAPHVAEARAMPTPGSPVIEVQRPDISRPVNVPVSFRVRFGASPGTTIDPRTFRATYGWLGIDITSRLLEHAALSQDGLSADDVNIPAGSHKVTLSIANNFGQVGSKTFEFTIPK